MVLSLKCTIAYLTLLLVSSVVSVHASSFLAKPPVGSGSEVVLEPAKPATDQAAQSILTLDRNHDGTIDKEEVAAFAKQQGFDIAVVTQEFSGLDANGDGNLDTKEIQAALGMGVVEPQVQQQQAPAVVHATAGPQELAPMATPNPISIAAAAEPKTPVDDLQAAATAAANTAARLALEKQQQAEQLQQLEAKRLQEQAMKQQLEMHRHEQEQIDEAVRQELQKHQQSAQEEQPQLMPTQAPSAPKELEPIKASSAEEVQSVKPIGAVEDDVRSVLAASSQLLSSAVNSSGAEVGSTSAMEVLFSQLGDEERMEADARSLEGMAKEYRAEAAEITRATVKSAYQAADGASRQKTEAVMLSLQQMEDQAAHIEVQAAAMRAKAEADNRKAADLMAVAKDAINLLHLG